MREDLGALFGGVVVPEATPSPRTIRFATPPLGDGPSRAFTRDDVGDAPARPVFDVSVDVTNVLVGPDFVAVTIARADQWEHLLAPLLGAVTDAFADTGAPTPVVDRSVRPAPGPGGPVPTTRPVASNARGASSEPNGTAAIAPPASSRRPATRWRNVVRSRPCCSPTSTRRSRPSTGRAC